MSVQDLPSFTVKCILSDGALQSPNNTLNTGPGLTYKLILISLENRFPVNAEKIHIW